MLLKMTDFSGLYRHVSAHSGLLGGVTPCKPYVREGITTMTSRLKSMILTAVLSFTGLATLANAETTISSTNETYLGAVSYPGGLMERAGLRLSAPSEIKYLRVDVPSYCTGQVFEVGLVTNGTYLTAENLGGNLFSVNSGRGLYVDGVYLSINGPQSAGCSVLVFKVESNPTPIPPPAPTQEFAYVCLTNGARAAIPTNVSTPSGTTQGVVYPGQTVIISQPVLPGRVIPNLSVSFDADASLGYLPMSVYVASTIMPVGNCQYAPLYQYVEDVAMRRLNLVRLR